MSPSLKTLTGKQARHLRALAHNVKPVVQLGKHGWTDAVRAEIDQALLSHELIKIKVGGECPAAPPELERQLAGLGAVIAQRIGAILVVYRAHPKKPKIRLPSAAGSSAPA